MPMPCLFLLCNLPEISLQPCLNSTWLGLQVAEEEVYTTDGSLDIDGNPALKHRTGGWRACRSILGTEFCQCLAYFGMTINLVTYLTTELHQSNVAAAKNVSTWQATCFLTPLAGAIVADSYWGKYHTMVVGCCIGVAGLLMASLSALLPLLIKNISTLAMASAQEFVLFLGLYMIAFGVGGLRPCLMSFGADQFDAGDPSERNSKGSYFNWYLFTMNCASVISTTAMVWLQDHYGWALGLAIPAMVLAVGLSFLVAATPAYRFQRNRGSPFTRVCQVVVAAVRKFNVAPPADVALLYEVPEDDCSMERVKRIKHTDDLQFFDKAAVVTASDEEAAGDPWRLCSLTQVEELKILVRMLPLWASIAFFYTGTAQVNSMSVEQGMAMDARVGSLRVPPASLATFELLTSMALIPLYDRAFVPAARRLAGREKGIPDLLRIGAGLTMAVLAMAAAALVETKRARAARMGMEKTSIVWQVPQYAVMGVGEMLASAGQLDFFYSQAPPAMKTVCMALGFLAVAAGVYLSSLVLTAVSWATATGGRPGWIPDDLNEGHLDRFFWMMAGLGCLNLVAFTSCAMRYKSRKDC
ncbi:Os06g0706100 [Oryza sativa Japonica Group]|uniref:Os06g0706100 protein n=1 Tax=Oryza sativa subsp. japonica TaxID=39947 RepID=A0A0P0X0M0_ORYSJ|nr:Os06g0706100 [Oryza sativa Japonica Group]